MIKEIKIEKNIEIPKKTKWSGIKELNIGDCLTIYYDKTTTKNQILCIANNVRSVSIRHAKQTNKEFTTMVFKDKFLIRTWRIK